jgi:hypothetical protein
LKNALPRSGNTVPDTNIILGVQWLSTLGPITTNYKTMEMSFNTEEGKRVTLKGMTRDSPRVVSAKQMFAIFRREEIVYAIERFIMETNDGTNKQYLPDIQRILHKHKRFFGLFLQDNHQTGGLNIL